MEEQRKISRLPIWVWVPFFGAVAHHLFITIQLRKLDAVWKWESIMRSSLIGLCTIVGESFAALLSWAVGVGGVDSPLFYIISVFVIWPCIVPPTIAYSKYAEKLLDEKFPADAVLLDDNNQDEHYS